MRERLRDWRNWCRAGCVTSVLGLSLAVAADPPPLKLFDLSLPQLRSAAPAAPPVATNASPVEELVLQTKVATEIDLLVQRHEAMNGSPLLSSRSVVRDTSRFQRTLDSLLPPNGALLQQNPNALSSPLRMSEYWAK